jgi:putative transposase
VDFVRDLSERTEITQNRIVTWIGISRGKFFDWKQRYGKANEHNAQVPRDHWLTDEVRISVDREHADRMMVNTGIG